MQMEIKRNWVAIFISNKTDIKDCYRKQGSTLHNDQGIKKKKI